MQLLCISVYFQQLQILNSVENAVKVCEVRVVHSSRNVTYSC